MLAENEPLAPTDTPLHNHPLVLKIRNCCSIPGKTTGVNAQPNFLLFPFPPLLFGPYCDKPLGCKTIKMLITSHQEAQPLILIYELPTFKARCSSDRVLRRWSRVPVFNSPLRAAGALSIANTPRHTGRARVCKSTGAGIAPPVWCGSLS